MARPSTATYMAIPPPPLPEFYRKAETKSDTATSSTSGTDNDSHNFKLPAMPGDGADDRWTYSKVNKPSSQVRALAVDDPNDDMPPLAVYHICRICLRPRSARYHREHPIPLDGLPPPPGICRRCRVSSVDELKTVTEVVEKKESNDLKIGIKAFVPDEDCFTNEEMRAKRARRVLSDASWREIEPRRDHRTSIFKSTKFVAPEPKSPPPAREEIIYRHIHVSVPPPLPRSPPRPVVHAASTSQDAIDAVYAKDSDPATAKYTTYRIPPPPPPQMRFTPVPQPAEVEVDASVTSLASASSKSKTRSTSHHASVSVHTNGRHRSETEIRRLARDEVERYRQAERRMEAHRDPYAHGKMVEVDRVPVERRIALEKDTAEPVPWAASRKDSAIANHKGSSRAEEREVELVVRGSRAADDGRSASARMPRNAPPCSPPSSISSDKTRWPSAVPPPGAIRGRPSDDTDTSSRRSYIIAERTSAKDCITSRGPNEPRHELAQRFEQNRPQFRRGASEAPAKEVEVRYESMEKEARLPDRVAELQRGSERQERAEAWSKETQEATSGPNSSKCTDREYPNGTNPARTDMAYTRSRKMDQSPQREMETSTKGMEIRRRRVESLPYPRDGSCTPVSMPSPSSHVSRPTRIPPPTQSQSRKQDDGEYVYVERKVQSLGKSPKSSRDYDEYEEVERYIHRTKPQPEQSGGKSSANTRVREEDMKRRPSDASSRVRFSKKVEISPTPPGSDASSSQFRNFSQIKSQGREIESGADLIAEYEHRGRQRSRVPPSNVDYSERKIRPDPEIDRDQTPRPGLRQRRRSGSTETAEVSSNLGHLARCFSESPSRERLDEAARRQRRDEGLAPYSINERRSGSVDVEDGSSVSSGSWSQQSYRETYRDSDGRRGAR